MSTTTAERVDLPVSGMSCAACARAIENQLRATVGVSQRACQFRHRHRHRGIRSRARARCAT